MNELKTSESVMADDAGGEETLYNAFFWPTSTVIYNPIQCLDNTDGDFLTISLTFRAKSTRTFVCQPIMVSVTGFLLNVYTIQVSKF